MADDVKDWHTKLTEAERNLLTQIFRFFVQADIAVSNCYHKHYARVFKPTEVQMMLAAFSNAESIHVFSYAYLLDTIGMPDSEFSAFMNYQEMQDKFDFYSRFGTKTPEDIATTLAVFGAFTEGLQLFASFCILMNFPRFNKMKGMGQIVSWSIRDECYSDDTEILTDSGWKLFKDLAERDLVAQFDKDTKVITFIKPKRIVSYDVDKELVELKTQNPNINFMVTPAHRKLVYKDGKPEVIEAKDLRCHHRTKLPVSGYGAGSKRELTPLERLMIAFQADGTMPPGENRTGERCGYRRCAIAIKKPRKIERLRAILREAGVNYYESTSHVREGMIKFIIDMPTWVTKHFSEWVSLSDIGSEWADAFMNELVHWDGHIRESGTFYYSTTEPSNMDYVQAIAALGGWKTVRYAQEDNRKETYKTVHRCTFTKTETTPLSHKSQTRLVPYKGKVWCVEVDTGFVVVRRGNQVCVSGNTIHCTGIIKLFHAFLKEHPSVWTPAFQQRLYDACNTIVVNEDRFVDLAFAMGPVDGLTAQDVKTYIRWVADRRLIQLGLKPMWKGASNPLPWMDEIMNGVEHANFFESRATEYSKAATEGNWGEVFA